MRLIIAEDSAWQSSPPVDSVDGVDGADGVDGVDGVDGGEAVSIFEQLVLVTQTVIRPVSANH